MLPLSIKQFYYSLYSRSQSNRGGKGGTWHPLGFHKKNTQSQSYFFKGYLLKESFWLVVSPQPWAHVGGHRGRSNGGPSCSPCECLPRWSCQYPAKVLGLVAPGPTLCSQRPLQSFRHWKTVCSSTAVRTGLDPHLFAVALMKLKLRLSSPTSSKWRRFVFFSWVGMAFAYQRWLRFLSHRQAKTGA